MPKRSRAGTTAAPTAVLQERWSEGCYGQRAICQVPGGCGLFFGNLLLKGERFILLLTLRGIKAQRLSQARAPLFPRTASLPADPFRPGVAQPLVLLLLLFLCLLFCFVCSFVWGFLLSLSSCPSRHLFFLCFLSHLTCPGAIQFTDGRYWIYSPRQRRLRTTSFSSGTVSERAST